MTQAFKPQQRGFRLRAMLLSPKRGFASNYPEHRFKFGQHLNEALRDLGYAKSSCTTPTHKACGEIGFSCEVLKGRLETESHSFSMKV